MNQIKSVQARIDAFESEVESGGDDYEMAPDKLKSYQADIKKLGDLRSQYDSAVEAQKHKKYFSGTNPVNPYGVDDEPENDDNKNISQNTSEKSVYKIRFGNIDDAVNQVLTDLHGKNWMEKRYKQWGAFERYLREYDRPLDREDHTLLSQTILTPNLAAKAIKEGFNISGLKSTMVEGIGDLGGYAVPVDFQTMVIERLMGMTVVRGRAFQMQTSRDKVQIPRSTGGDSQYSSAVRVTWVEETPTAGTADTNLTLGQEEIDVYTMMAETSLSRNLLEDSAFNLQAYLGQKFAEASAINEDNKFLIGDGVDGPKGILPGQSNVNSFTEVASGDASEITYDGIIGLAFALDSQYKQNAVYIGAKNTWAAVAKLREGDGTGQYLWRRDFGNYKDGQPATIEGHTVLMQEALPSVAAGNYPLVFGDLNGYTIVDRVGMTIERYLDSSTAQKNQVLYVMRRRLGGQPTESWRFAVMKVAAS